MYYQKVMYRLCTVFDLLRGAVVVLMSPLTFPPLPLRVRFIPLGVQPIPNEPTRPATEPST